MSKDFSDCYREYTLLSEAYYADTTLQREDFIDEVNFQLADHDGGTAGEMNVRWYQIGEGAPSACLECYGYAWPVLGTFKDVIDAMAEVDRQDITPKHFCQMLDDLGFVDGTPRKSKADTVSGIEPAEELLKSIQTKAKEAHEAKDIFMMGVFTDMLASVSPIVSKARARLEREEMARINREHKELRAKKRAEQEG